MKNWYKRVILGVAAGAGAISITANIVQYQMYNDLIHQTNERCSAFSAKITEKDAEIAEKDSTIIRLQKDLAFEEMIHGILQEDLDEIMDATLSYYKEQAAEAGFDPDEQDWIYAGNGQWYFFYY